MRFRWQFLVVSSRQKGLVMSPWRPHFTHTKSTQQTPRRDNPQGKLKILSYSIWAVVKNKEKIINDNGSFVGAFMHCDNNFKSILMEQTTVLLFPEFSKVLSELFSTMWYKKSWVSYRSEKTSTKLDECTEDGEDKATTFITFPVWKICWTPRLRFSCEKGSYRLFCFWKIAKAFQLANLLRNTIESLTIEWLKRDMHVYSKTGSYGTK